VVVPPGVFNWLIISTTVVVRCVFACDGSAERVFGGGGASAVAGNVRPGE